MTEPAVEKTEAPAVDSSPPADEEKAASKAEEAAPAPVKKTKIFIIFYSTYGHIYKLAETYKKALEAIDSVDVQMYQVVEIAY